MELVIKILIIPGVNTRTINDKVCIESGSTLSFILRLINDRYNIDFTEINNCIMLLDGRRVDCCSDSDLSIENCKEFMVIPMISGG
jgi:hypothetical protein